MSIETASTIAGLVVRRFSDSVSVTPSQRSLCQFVRNAGGAFVERSWNDLLCEVVEIAEAIVEAGFERGDRVALCGRNSDCWVAADLAIQVLGGVVVAINPMLPGPVITNVLSVAKPSRLIDVEPTLQRFRKCPLGFVVNRDTWQQESCNEPTGLRNRIDWLAEQAARVKPNDLASIIFTSGTTGEPRGVMLTHANVLANARAAAEAFASNHHEVRLNLLPFSHAFARTADLYTWLLRGSTMAVGSTRETVFDDLLEVRPTFINAVPYFYDRLWKRLRAQGIDQQPDAVKTALGGNIRACVSGGAGLPRDVEDYYASQGVPILQGYGLTEAGPIVSMSTRSDYRAGTVGKPLPGTELRFADDGELLVRGPQVMAGYWQDESATAAAFDADGFLKTGDIARLDDDGFLAITGRKKECLVLSTGHNVWPGAIEAQLMSDPYIAQVAVLGDGESHLTALIVPEPEPLRRFVKEKRLWVFTRSQALRHKSVRELFATRIAERLKDRARHEQIERFVLLPQAFSLEAGEITPKLSLRRDVIARRFSRDIARG